jgi:hypothetical protein
LAAENGLPRTIDLDAARIEDMKILATFVLAAVCAAFLPAAIPAPQPSSNINSYASSAKPHKHRRHHKVTKHRAQQH